MYAWCQVSAYVTPDSESSDKGRQIGAAGVGALYLSVCISVCVCVYADGNNNVDKTDDSGNNFGTNSKDTNSNDEDILNVGEGGA